VPTSKCTVIVVSNEYFGHLVVVVHLSLKHITLAGLEVVAFIIQIEFIWLDILLSIKFAKCRQINIRIRPSSILVTGVNFNDPCYGWRELFSKLRKFHVVYKQVCYHHHHHQKSLCGLTIACWITDFYHPCSNLGMGKSEGCFIFDCASLPLEVAQPI